MQDESEEDSILFLRHPHHLPSAGEQFSLHLLYYRSLSHLLCQMKENNSNTTHLPLHMRLSTDPNLNVETSPPQLLMRLTTPPLRKRGRELSSESNERWKSSEKESTPGSKRVASELEKWAGVSDKEKGKAFDSCLAEINSLLAVQDGDRSITRETPPVETNLSTERQSRRKRIREEAEELLDQVLSGEEFEGEEIQQRVVRKRAKEEDMPWYKSTSSSSRRGSCVETCRILLQFSEDLPGVKSLLRVADNLPEGIPSSQWDRIL